MFKKIVIYIRNSRFVEISKEFYEKAKIKNIERYQKKEAEFLPASLEIIESPPAYGSRTVLWSFFSLAIIALLWVTFGSVDEVTVASGKIIPNGYVRVLQAEDKGVIKEIYVTDGKKVKKGDLLLAFDPTVSEADLAIMKKKVAYASLEVERLTSEKENRPFNPQNIPDADEVDIKNQFNLYNSRWLEYNAKMNEAIQGVQQSKTDLKKTLTEEEKQKELFQIAKDKEGQLQYLLDQNAISKFNLLDQQAKRLELQKDMEEQGAAIEAQQALLAKSQAAMNRTIAERATDIDTNLTAATKNLADCSEQLKKSEEKYGLSKIIAPDDGYVSNLSVHTIGGVVTPAQTIMEIVPEHATLEAEVWVSNKDIGFIRIGQPVELKIETFNFQKYGTVPAMVTTISPNAVDDSEKGRVFKVLLQVNKENVEVNGRELRLGSGMTVSAEIKTRGKKIYEYFLEPFKKYISQSLRER
ncbi:hemolysin D [Sporomusaceae bacterium BoRhaA]|uniref:HlyD family type I secretion periplasmic adaptor subunit n=1 Tax=Pelorhabdus rhamnosifermentans TaxID=2772457 RepID=UPI001C062E25|nr:HlyD family type I secretion periplasmic adaptor subunit [Pelorhabdus rhamnosifermentans]MBU2699414.1 hemolysin D [Pelorhabdus rhamnosifermentans]